MIRKKFVIALVLAVVALAAFASFALAQAPTAAITAPTNGATVSGKVDVTGTAVGPFWSIRPAPILFWSAVATKVIATLAAVYGMFMVPIGWPWALLIWGYALVWFLVNDRIKLAAYQIFDTRRTSVLAGLVGK